MSKSSCKPVGKYEMKPFYRMSLDSPMYIHVQAGRSEELGSVGHGSLGNFERMLIGKVEEMLKAYSITSPLRHAFNEKRYTEGIQDALSWGSWLYLRFKLIKKEEPLHFKSKVLVDWSAFDQSLIVSYLQRHLDHWGCEPWLWAVESSTDYEALKRGCVPVTICLGTYHDLVDLGQIEQKYERVAQAVTRALCNYLFPIYHGSDPEEVKKAGLMEQIGRDYRADSQGSLIHHNDLESLEGLEVPF